MSRPDGSPTPEELKVDGFDGRRGEGRWSPEEDCPGCDGHKDGADGHPEGGHRFGCTLHGAQQLKIPVRA